MSLTLSAQPGFADLADSTFDAGNPLTAANMKSLNADAKFAAVRNEQFWGYYRDGETVGVPTSPADGYVYSRGELVYTWSVYWTGSATGALNGTQTAPARGATGGAGTFLQAGYSVDQATGDVACATSYFSGAQHDVADGILLVMVHAQRSR